MRLSGATSIRRLLRRSAITIGYGSGLPQEGTNLVRLPVTGGIGGKTAPLETMPAPVQPISRVFTARRLAARIFEQGSQSIRSPQSTSQPQHASHLLSWAATTHVPSAPAIPATAALIRTLSRGALPLLHYRQRPIREWYLKGFSDLMIAN